jgi:hypothetical protein
MRWNPLRRDPHRDPIDAVLSGEPLDEDLLDVAAIVHDIRATYLPMAPVDARVGSFDARVGSISDRRNAEPTGRKPRTMLSTFGGFVGTLTGKVLAGTAVAAASVGGLHAADVVDVPGLPGNDRPAAEQSGAASADVDATSADAAAEGQQTAAEKQAAAQAYTDAVRAWTDCVADAAAAQGDEESRVTGGFDPRDECGDRPRPEAYGLTDLPSQAADAAEGVVEGTPAESVKPDAASNAGAATPAPQDAGASDPTDRGSDVPATGGGNDPTNRDGDVPSSGSDTPTGGGMPGGGRP